eukprot:4111240-Pyramimonas_sp.AAC.1
MFELGLYLANGGNAKPGTKTHRRCHYSQGGSDTRGPRRCPGGPHKPIVGVVSSSLAHIYPKVPGCLILLMPKDSSEKGIDALLHPMGALGVRHRAMGQS